MSGVDNNGYTPKTLTEIIASLNTGYQGVYGSAVNLASRSRIGQRVALFAGALAEVWELGQAIYNSLDPLNSSGAGLDNLLGINGLTRKPATASTVQLTLTGTAASVIPSGTVIGVGPSGNQFATTAAATIVARSAWQASHSYSSGTTVLNGGNVYISTRAGTSASSGGPSGTGTGIADGGVFWTYLGPGAGSVVVNAQATATGALQGFARTITTIITPKSGLAGATNLLDAAVGQNVETDAEARVRRGQSFGAQALDSLDAVRTAVLAVSGVSSCTIFENYTDVTNADGVPPHSFETLVVGGVDADIQAAIFSKRPGGIQPYGNTTGTVTDTTGNAFSIGFSRPVPVNIYVGISLLQYQIGVYPIDGDVQVADSIATRQNAQRAGKNVVATNIAAGIFQDIPGVLDVPTVFIGTSASPSTSTTINITSRQQAVYDTSRVTVSSVAGSF